MVAARDPYEVLQVHPSALPEVVEAAYRALALVHHPDRNGNHGQAAMAELNAAYALLRDPERRMEYDRTRVAIAIGSSTRSSLMERMQQARNADLGGSGESPARATIDFGRYAGMTLAELARVDPAYLEWLRRHSSGARYRHQIDAVLGALAARRAAAVRVAVED